MHNVRSCHPANLPSNRAWVANICCLPPQGYMQRFSIIIPTLNEAGNILPLLRRIQLMTLRHGLEQEILIVDDVYCSGLETDLKHISQFAPVKLTQRPSHSIKQTMNILIIEDEPELSEKIQALLESEKYTVTTAADGNVGLEKIWNNIYDLIILDIMLPGKNGLDILVEIRDADISAPVLILTARGDLDDKVTGLNLGADDYLAKPFSVAELLARIRALFRRGNTGNPIIEIGDIRLNTISREVTKNSEILFLTTKEFAILEFLLHNRGRTISRFSLAEHVWGDNFDPFSMSNFIDVHMSNLRKKLKSPERKQIIRSIRGVGYLIDRD